MYLLDAGIVIGFQQANLLADLVTLARTLPMAIVEEVHDELTDAARGKPAEARRASEALDGSDIDVVKILVGSDAARTLTEMRDGRSSVKDKDLGEDASIAFAMFDPRFTFVSHERVAIFCAVSCLEGRVMTFHPFLRTAVARGAITRGRAVALGTAVLAAKKSWPPAPVWWHRWGVEGAAQDG